ncbi:NADH:flavin oxidoreductase/NADH oxidase [Rubellimicrobium mesophilum DSM 19309]|uniref:NADH:flavin oxidoreductase/NADH oxidase n=1 Tax=Rubellimicrobium mesophilum DSM 19309 TaxID=442562 RepID=A0A017HQC4_9RHOB|nr:NADH:flavin oxidoreductase/NADH oxidase [Rubellimicrobium mesophilum]EYD75969.1 NADH:flavin oxidoreductase/NADH oxidase [Rubellimicrobium mesophilum DSM 19309]
MSLLFSPISLRGLTVSNRLVVTPMCQYSASGGLATDYHLVHLGRFALGGFGTVIVEATAVTPEGRITYADLGLWSDDQTAPLARIVDVLHAQGAAAGIQLAHAGRKAASPVPWREGFDETEEEKPLVGFEDWRPVSPSAVSHAPESPDYKVPHALTAPELSALRDAFVAAARRAETAGFDLVEVHSAHGYLLHQFLSPVANKREDEWGGSLENRMRFPLSVAKAVREAWPAHKPMFVRISAQDGIPGGWTLEDSVAYARALKEIGADLIDCSSGGFAGGQFALGPSYQVPLAHGVREGAVLPTMAVGLVTNAGEAEAVVAEGSADLVALGRAALDDPNWPLHARHELATREDAYADWPLPSGYAVRNMDRALHRRGFAKAG